MSDMVIVVAITDTGAKSAAHGVSLFIVDAGAPGFRKGRKLEKMGLKAQVSSHCVNFYSHKAFNIFSKFYAIKIS